MITLTDPERHQTANSGLVAVVHEWGPGAPNAEPVYDLTPEEVPGVLKVLTILEDLQKSFRESLIEPPKRRDANLAQVALTGLRLEREAFGPWELAVSAVVTEPVPEEWVRSGLTMTQAPASNGEDYLYCHDCLGLLEEDPEATHFRANGKPVAALCRSCRESAGEGPTHPILRLALKTGTWEKLPDSRGVDNG